MGAGEGVRVELLPRRREDLGFSEAPVYSDLGPNSDALVSERYSSPFRRQASAAIYTTARRT